MRAPSDVSGCESVSIGCDATGLGAKLTIGKNSGDLLRLLVDGSIDAGGDQDLGHRRGLVAEQMLELCCETIWSQIQVGGRR